MVDRARLSIGAIGAALLVACSNGLHAQQVESLDDGPYADVVSPASESEKVGNLLYLSDQVGEDADGMLVEGGVEAEAEQVMSNIKAALQRHGLGMEHLVNCNVFLADIDEWGTFDEIFTKHIDPPFQARSALEADGLAINARVELECIAAFPE